MKTFILFFIFLSFSLYANGVENSCKTDLNNMTKFYTQGKNLSYKKEDSLAKENFFKSVESANSALISCQDSLNFDFNPLYDYIVSGEENINRLENGSE